MNFGGPLRDHTELTSGRLFDSLDPVTSGHARGYWFDGPCAAILAPLADTLGACEILLQAVQK